MYEEELVMFVSLFRIHLVACLPSRTVRISESIGEDDVAAKSVENQFQVLPIHERQV